MLGLADFRVLDAREVEGEVELDVETTADRDWCRGCGVGAVRKDRITGWCATWTRSAGRRGCGGASAGGAVRSLRVR